MRPSERVMRRQMATPVNIPTKTTAPQPSTTEFKAPAMITAFVPPKTCTEHAVVTSFRDEAKQSYEYWVKWAPDTNIAQGGAKGDFMGCYPSNFASVWDASKDQFYGPATCPVGYEAHKLAKSGSFHREQCCLRGFKPHANALGKCTTVLGTMTVSAPAFNIRYEDKDIPSFVIPGMTSTTAVAATISSSANALDTGKAEAAKSDGPKAVPLPAKAEMEKETGMSTGAKVALGVLLPVLAILIAVALFLFLKRRKQKAKKNGLEFSDADSPTGSRSMSAIGGMNISAPIKPDPAKSVISGDFEKGIPELDDVRMYGDIEKDPALLNPSANINANGGVSYYNPSIANLANNNAKAWEAGTAGQQQSPADAPPYWRQPDSPSPGIRASLDREIDPQWETASFPPATVALAHKKSVRPLTVTKRTKLAKLKIATADNGAPSPMRPSPTSVYAPSEYQYSPTTPGGKPRMTTYLEYYMVPNPSDNPVPAIPAGLQPTKTGNYY